MSPRFSKHTWCRKVERLLRRAARWVCCLVLAVLATGADRGLAEEQIVAIVHPENEISALTLHDLRLMYGLYRRIWSSGSQVRLVLPLPQTTEMDFLMHRVFRRMKSEADIDRFYFEALFQQQIGARPEQLSVRETLSFVGAMPGGVALVVRDELVAIPGVRVLEIGGEAESD